MQLRHIFSFAALAAAVLQTAAAGPLPSLPASARAIHLDAAAASGLNGGIYVLPDAAGQRLSVSLQPGQSAHWEMFDRRGAAYAEAVTPVAQSATESTVVLPAGDCGVTVEVGGAVTYLWIVDYATHPLRLESVTFPAEQDCDRTTLQLNGTGDRIQYYGINGNPVELSRDITVEYSTLTYNADSHSYTVQTASAQVPYVRTVAVPAPLCNTVFDISGDRFTSVWGQTQHVQSEQWTARAVSVETRAEQQQREVPNEVKDQNGSLGGSAPCDITFDAAVTDAAVFREWQMSSDPEFNDIELRANDLDFSYTFRETGMRYVRFVAADADGVCTYTGPVYEVSIGESSLKCPNVFTPFTTPGVNDEWRVSYRSLVSYECHIYNLQGQEVFASTDPAKGWDGRFRGRKVPTGTYYYAIVARGSDGKQYKLGGDINIVGGNASAGTGTGDAE